MSRQKYTRWRASDDEYDEEHEENGQLSELRDEDEREARRVFTLMTPQRESSQVTAGNTLKFICIGVLMCLVCMFGGALIGFFVGNRQLNTPAPVPAPVTVPTTSTTTTTPAPPSPPVQPPSCEDPDPFKNIPSVAMKFLPLINESRIRYYIDAISKKHPSDLGKYLQQTLTNLGYQMKSEVFEVSRPFAPHDEPGKVEVDYRNKSSVLLLNSTSTKLSFNGYSGNGSFSGPVVYGHYATLSDLAVLKEENVTLNNSVMMIRIGKLHPADQVRNAESHGVKAVLLYPDPEDFGGKNYYPNGTALPLDGFINSNLNLPGGDPATVGYTSQKGSYRLSVQNFTNIPKIPVLSISAKEAKLLFKMIEGKFAYHWQGGLDEQYIYGGSFTAKSNVTAVRVSVSSDVGSATLNTIHATIPAKDTQNVVHVGVHYDPTKKVVPFSGIGLAAWLTFAEALINFSPNGTRRMVYLSAFAGVEGDFSGGREFTDLFRNWLDATSIAYIDFDNMISGRGFLDARVSPLLVKTLEESLHHVEWPEKKNTSVLQGLITKSNEYDNNQHIRLDYNKNEPIVCGESSNFGINLGISTFQLSSINITKSKYNLENSQYDSLQTGVHMIDPDLKWTRMVASLLSMSSLLLANARMPPVDMEHYARNLKNKWYNLKINSSIQTSKYKFENVIDEINSEFDILINRFDKITLWYSSINSEKDKKNYQIQREMDRLQGLKLVQRAFMRPPSLPSPSSDGLSLIYGPDVNDSCRGVYYPMARKILSDILAGKRQWEELHKEFSIILSALSSLNRMPFLNS